MFPISDVIPSRTTPVVTVGLILLNVAIFLYQQALPDPQLQRFVGSYALIPAWFAWPALITSQFLHVGGATRNPRPAAEADKEILAHGVSVVEVRKVNGKFAVQKESPYNRRITPMTPMQLSGPVRGHALVKTKYSASGNDCRGTIGNCGTGYTPWGTLLTGEEGWSDCFKRGDDEAARGGPMGRDSVSLRRYGVLRRPQPFRRR